ncbi:MAG: LysE family translocator [Rubrivivax sp.]|nr:LysE family translocator [Rubrivivax sp.]
MSGPEWAALLFVAAAMSFTPGPNTTLAAALGANHGLRHAMRFVLGVPVGWGFVLAASALGLGAVLQAAPVLRVALKWAGVGYLLWLAWRLAATSRLPAAGEPGRFDVGFGQGVLLQFVNVKAWVLALVVSVGWINGAEAASPAATAAGAASFSAVVPATWSRLAQVLPVLMLFALASNLTYAGVGAALRRWLAAGRRLAHFNRALALLLAGTALWMAWA